MAGEKGKAQAAGRISSPGQLDDYLHVTNLKIWLLLIAVILLIAGLLVWSASVTVESYATGSAQVENGQATVKFDNAEKASKVQVGMEVDIGGNHAQITTVNTDANGNVVATAQARIPDGAYDARVGYSTMQVISLLFN